MRNSVMDLYTKQSLTFLASVLLLFTFAGTETVYAQGLGLGLNRNKNKSFEADYGNPKIYEIGGIKVTGATFLDPRAIISMAGLKVGDKIRIPGEDISKAIRKLWDQGLLGDVSINAAKVEGDKIFLNIELTERPRLSDFTFEGIPKGQQRTLTERINLIRGRIVNDVSVKNAVNIIKDYYVEKGFKNVGVEVRKKDDPNLDNRIILDIEVNKNERVKISDINFEGISAFKEAKLQRKMKKTKEKRGHRIFSASKFIPEEFDGDKEKVIDFYNKQGYRDAQIISDSVYFTEDDRVAIDLKVNEGRQYFFRDITWSGNYVYKDSVLSKVLGIKKGDVYNPEELNKNLNFNPAGMDVSSLYMDRGYLFFSVNPIEVGIDGDSVDIEMRIFEGEQATVSKVTIRGNTITSDHVVRREIRTLPGDKFSRAALLRTQRELTQLGYFDPEQMNVVPKPNFNDGTVDIEYTVAEKPNNQIELSGGWGGFFGFVGTVGLNLNNFSLRKVTKPKEWTPLPQGDGQTLSLRVQANGRQFQTYSFTFAEPWLGGRRRNFFSLSLQHSVQRTLDRNARATGNLQVSGVTLSLGRRLNFPDDYFSLNNSVSFLRYTLNNFNAGFRSINDGDFNNVVFNTTLSRNSTDHPIYPMQGSNVTLSLAVTPPYSAFRAERRTVENTGEAELFKWVEYHKWMFDNWWYMRIVDKLVLCTRMHFGYIGAYQSGIGVSPFERFIMGGDGLSFGNILLGQDIIGLRGYTNNSIVPFTSSLDRSEGGTVFTKMVTEIRYPLTMSQATSIYVLAFAEGGNNWGSIQSFSPLDVKRSVGIGARIFMPAFGMLGVDYGWGFDQVPGNPSANGGQFHFTIGQMIR